MYNQVNSFLIANGRKIETRLRMDMCLFSLCVCVSMYVQSSRILCHDVPFWLALGNNQIERNVMTLFCIIVYIFGWSVDSLKEREGGSTGKEVSKEDSGNHWDWETSIMATYQIGGEGFLVRIVDNMLLHTGAT